MKYNIKKKIYLDMTLDSSELVMFNKGGKFKVEISSDILAAQIGYDDEGKLSRYVPVELSVQIDPAEKYRFNFVTDNKHVNKPDVKCDDMEKEPNHILRVNGSYNHLEPIPPEMMPRREVDQTNTPHCCKENVNIPTVRML
jgi:hypothetical protein